MEDIKFMRMRKDNLLLELQALEQNISLYEAMTTATKVPEDESLKTKASPAQTETGKDKIKSVDSSCFAKKQNEEPSSSKKTTDLIKSSTSVFENNRMTLLSPSKNSTAKIEDLTPDYMKALRKPSENFYVIYSGPHKGIHTDWGVTEDFCKNDKVTCKKFNNESLAKMSLQTYSDQGNSKSQITLLRPKMRKKKEEHRDQRFLVPDEIQEVMEKAIISFSDFRTLWLKARSLSPEDLVQEKMFSTDKKSKSLFNFIEGAEASIVHSAFKAGLIDNIYPSSNLQEIRYFPQGIIKAIKDFRKKVLKAKDSPIYIKVTSSIPDWKHEEKFCSYHFLEIGIAKATRELQVSQIIEDSDRPFPDILHTVRIQGLRRIAEKLSESISSGKRKVNYVDSDTIVTSRSFSNHTAEDQTLISRFGKAFLDNSFEATPETKTSFCKQVEQLFEDHACDFCSDKNKKRRLHH